MRRITFLAFALLLVGCSSPISTASTDNQNFRVDLLFENDGCRVYRFFDGGSARYYARCAPGWSAADTTWEHVVSTGKMTIIYHEGVAGGR